MKSLPASLAATICSFLAIAILPSCETAHFYAQGIKGQVSILHNTRPVSQLIADPATPRPLRERLQFTESLRRFAIQELHLPAEHAYNTYKDLQRPHVVWVVFAAPEFSVEPHQWSYPFLGKLNYRGYFNEADARKLSAKLKQDGLDVVGGGVDAYSSLGYFNDPLLNTFINDPEVDLAELLFHELTHRKVFIAGDTDFNEALATATSQACVVRWLKATGRTQDLRRYERRLKQAELFSQEVLNTRAELAALYSQPLPVEMMRQRKVALLAKLSARIKSMPELSEEKAFRAWADKPLNNARLNTIHSYHAMIPQFHALLEKCGGNLDAYFKQVRTLKR